MKNVVNSVILIRIDDLYKNIGCACCTYSKCIFDANISKDFPFKTTPLNMVCENGYY